MDTDVVAQSPPNGSMVHPRSRPECAAVFGEILTYVKAYTGSGNNVVISLSLSVRSDRYFTDFDKANRLKKLP